MGALKAITRCGGERNSKLLYLLRFIGLFGHAQLLGVTNPTTILYPIADNISAVTQ